jgi:hypothetical protein
MARSTESWSTTPKVRLLSPSGPAKLAPMSSASHVPILQNLYDLLNMEPTLTEAAAARVERWEGQTGLTLPRGRSRRVTGHHPRADYQAWADLEE